MIIDLTPHLETLRRHHGRVYIAIVSKKDSEQLKGEFTSVRSELQFGTLPDGRATVASRGNSDQIRSFLFIKGISVDTWIDLREEDEHYEEATYVTDMDGRYVRVQTGMLDDLFGYIAVQSPRFGDADTVIEDIEIKSDGRFDALYERIATPADVR